MKSQKDLDAVIAKAVRDRDARERDYRAQSLKIHPWVCGDGPGSGFVSSSGAGASGVWESGNLEILPLWDPGRKIGFSNGLVHNKSQISGT